MFKINQGSACSLGSLVSNAIERSELPVTIKFKFRGTDGNMKQIRLDLFLFREGSDGFSFQVCIIEANIFHLL